MSLDSAGHRVQKRQGDPERFHDLDALRAFAMLLGIVLHAATPFVPYWHEGQSGSAFLGGLFIAIHGFRMPLFFLLSGFFTSLLWRRRGTRALLQHRLRRVGLPFVLALLTILPLVWWAQLWGFRRIGAQLPPDVADAPWFPVAHLWFLWFLLIYVAGFALTVTGWTRWQAARPRGGIAKHWSRYRLPVSSALLLGAAVAAQSRMNQGWFGPDTSEGLIPLPRTLVVYACYFAWGALLYGHTDRRGRPLIELLGRWWGVSLVIAVVLFATSNSTPGRVGWSVAVLQVAFALSASCALLGAFHQWFSSDRAWVRWLSDSSYWLYVAHVPLVLVGQGLVASWHLPPLLGFALILVTVTVILLLSYRYLIRYTPIGTLLNGPRYRTSHKSPASLTDPH